MAHEFQKHRDAERSKGHDRYMAAGGKSKGKPSHVSKHLHVNMIGGGGGAPGGLPAPAGPLPAPPSAGPPGPLPGAAGPPPGVPPMLPGMPPRPPGG